MEYLQNLYDRFFGPATEEGYYEPRKIVAFGNVLLDRTAQLTNDSTLLDRYQLQAGSKGELDAETLARITAEACRNYDCATNPGGSALNTTRILRKLGTNALFFGSVGDDKNGEELKKLLKENDLETKLQVNIGVRTGQCICLVNDKTATTMYANIGASEKFSVDFLKRAAQNESQSFLRPIERKQVLYIEGFFIPKREVVCDYIVSNYIRERRRLALNLSAPYIVQQNYEQILHLARHAFFIFGNSDEYQAFMDLLGVDTLEALGEKLLEGNTVKVIMVTKGAQGVHVISNYVDEYADAGTVTHQTYNAPRVTDLLDTTGAGDAFVAGFLNGWMQKRSLSECVRNAIDVSAKVVTQVGCNLPE